MESNLKNQDVTFYTKDINVPERCILACDVGGTNIRCALFEIDETTAPTLIFVLRVLTHEVVAFTDVISQALAIAYEKYHVVVKKAACALPGSPENNTDVWRFPNVAWTVEKQEILKKTTITDVVLLNDFEAIGYSLEVLTDKDLLCINQGTVNLQANKVVIGAGTGLGKCTAAWDPFSKRYVSVSSQGGLADFPIYNQEEFSLMHFVQKRLNQTTPIICENLLSGRGISHIYQYFEQDGMCASTKYSSIIKNHDYDPAIIARYKDTDECCKKTFELFSACYGRCAKNFTLEAQAFGGVYLAGGIAAKNTDICTNGIFMKEFLMNSFFKDLLAQTPIFIIINQDAGLYGAVHFAALNFAL